MLKSLISLANLYDQFGITKFADFFDQKAIKLAQSKEPSPQDLEEMQSWMDENIDQENPLDGLQGDDLTSAEAYLKGIPPEKIQPLLDQLKQNQQDLANSLTKMLDQNPIKAEANILHDLSKLANLLDQNLLTKEADQFDNFIHKIAQGLPPDDFEFDDDIQEPTTDELNEFEHNLPLADKITDFLADLAQGSFDLDQAKSKAQELLDLFDQEQGFDFHHIQEPESQIELPDNVLPFKQAE